MIVKKSRQILYIDITNTKNSLLHTGIQKLSIHIINGLIQTEINGLAVELIYYCQKNNKWIQIEKSNNLFTNKFVFSSQLLSKPWNYLYRNIHCLLTRRKVVWQENSFFLQLDSMWHHQIKWAELIEIFKSKKIQPVLYVHDLIPFSHPEWVHDKTAKKFIDFYSNFCPITKHYIVNSYSTKNELIPFLNNNKYEYSTVQVVSPGVNVKKMSSINKQVLKHKIILCIGTLEIRKNQKLLIEAFLKIKDRHPDYELTFVGKNGWKNEIVLNMLNKNTNRIQWLKYINNSELDDLIDKAYLCVFPSFFEGYGMPLAECLAHGKVTICSNINAHKEAGMDFAEYFSPNDKDELTILLDKYIDDLGYYKMRQTQIQNYPVRSWKKVHEEMTNAIKTIMSK